MNKQQRIIVLIPYFGKWPEWIDCFIESCKFNPTIDWLFFTNCASPSNYCKNVRYVNMSWSECQALISEKLDINFTLHHPYKLCDVKPAYGRVFSDYTWGYDFFAFGDVDVIYGNIRKFLTADVLGHDCITFNDNRVAGHFTLLRNVDSIKDAFKQIPNWEEKMAIQKMQFIDENNGFYGIQKVFNKESYNTPQSKFIPWLDGSFSFPTEWYWQNGQLTNDLNRNYEFLYLHFMRIRNNWRDQGITNAVSFDIADAKNGWKLNANGFYKLHNNDMINQPSIRAGFD